MKQKTSSREFVEWIVFLEKEEKETKKEDYYLAQIAAEIRRCFSSSNKRIKTEDFLLKFQSQPSKKQKVNSEKNMELSKAMWFAATGVGDRNV